MMLRRFCTGALAALLVLAAAPQPARAAFSDAAGHWAAEIIEKAEDYGLIQGYPDGTFGVEDEITRGQLQEEILRIHRESGITILFVTHDIAEALKLGTRTLVMDVGTVQQCDRPEELLRHPATDFVRELVEPQRRRDSILQR